MKLGGIVTMASVKARQLTWLFFAVFPFAVRPVTGAENMRVAYPSLSSSVMCILIANKEGYFKEEGINVEFLSIRGEIAIRTALAGEVDFFTNAGSAMAAAARNVPVKIVAVFQDKPGWDLIAQPNIKSIAQLRGSTIAIMSPEGSLAVVTRENFWKRMVWIRRKTPIWSLWRRRCSSSRDEG